MTPQELKNSILQLAMQGRLVEQRPEEGTAEDLYSQLINEKSVGIKEGLWGKSKSLTPVTDAEKLFEIPETWRWIKIGEIASIVTKGTTPRGGNVSYLDSGIGFLRAENIAGLDKLEKTTLKYIDENTHKGYLKRSILQANDILITIAGTLGRTAIVRESDLPLNANQAVAMVRLVNSKDLSLIYLIYALNSSEIQSYLTKQRKITAIPNLTLEIIENCLIPLPPLAEQKRIVAKIEELLPLIDRYEKAWSRLEDFNKRFPGDMQKSILQLAIQGRLVEQRPEEGTGEELYQQIQAEKQALIKAGKIKKEKPLPEITEDEVPFEIPESWKWVRIGCIFVTSSGTTPQSSNHQYYADGKYNWVRTTDLNNSTLKSCEIKVSEEAFKECRLAIIPRQSVCIAMYGGAGTIGKNAIIDFDTTINQSVCAIHPNAHCNMKYLFYYMQYQRPRWMDYASGTRKDPNINKIIIRSAVFPLPPLAEQKRIVAKLEELLPLCERLR